MGHEKALKSLDTGRLLAISAKVMSQLQHGEPNEGLTMPEEEYEALFALIRRANSMSIALEQKRDLEGSEVDDETISFLRGITAGIWITAEVLKEYWESEGFEEQFQPKG